MSTASPAVDRRSTCKVCGKFGYTGCTKKYRQPLVCCAGLQTDHCSRRKPCPETHGLGAVKASKLENERVSQFVQIRIGVLSRAQTNLAKLLLAKALLLKHARTCFLLLKIRHGAHQSRKKQKCFRARFSTF